MKLPNPCLILVTDRTRLSPNWALAQAIGPAVTGGCNLVLFRETDLPPNHRLTVARFVSDGINRRVPLLIADDAAIASTVGAQGVHLSDCSTDIAAVRGALAPGSIVGMSVNNREEAETSQAKGADYLLIEYDWANPDRVLAHFRELTDGIACPVILGTDMPAVLAPHCLSAGAAGIAICSPAMSAYDRTAACREYRVWSVKS